MSRKQDIYVSVDIECTGPCPGLNSMISIGAVACIEADNERGFTVVSEFAENLRELEGSRRDLDTMQFWAKNPNAWRAATYYPSPADQVIRSLVAWAESLPGRPVFCAFPAGFDFTFVYYYCHRFVGRCPFGYAALDMKSYAHAIMGGRLSKAAKRYMPKEWHDPNAKHTHVALEDAREQAYLFFQMRRAAKKLRQEVDD